MTNKELDLDDDDDNDAMDIASDEDDAIVYVTAGGILPPRPSLRGGRDEAPVTQRQPPPSSSSNREKTSQRRGERAMDEGYDNNEGVLGGGREGAGQVAGPLRWQRLPSQTRSWWSTSERSRTSDALLLLSSRPPRHRPVRGGMVGYLHSSSLTHSHATISRFGDECKFIYS